MLFYGTFQSLSTEELIRHFGDKLKITFNVGLNVLSPLLQSLSISNTGGFKDLLRNSPDPEIQSWPTERRRQHYNSAKRRPIATSPVPRTTKEDRIKHFVAIFCKMIYNSSLISDEDC